MKLLSSLLALVGCLAAAVVYLACGANDGTAPPPATIQASRTPTQGPSPTDVPPQGLTPTDVEAPIIDLATASPLTVVYAVGEGDLRSDQPGLAAGDVNNDGTDDIVVGARRPPSTSPQANKTSPSSGPGRAITWASLQPSPTWTATASTMLYWRPPSPGRWISPHPDPAGCTSCSVTVPCPPP